MQGSKLPR